MKNNNNIHKLVEQMDDMTSIHNLDKNEDSANYFNEKFLKELNTQLNKFPNYLDEEPYHLRNRNINQERDGNNYKPRLNPNLMRDIENRNENNKYSNYMETTNNVKRYQEKPEQFNQFKVELDYSNSIYNINRKKKKKNVKMQNDSDDDDYEVNNKKQKMANFKKSTDLYNGPKKNTSRNEMEHRSYPPEDNSGFKKFVPPMYSNLI
jgi:hypothetical protein